MLIREASGADLAAVWQVHALAFGGAEEADLVASLLDDPTAQPLVSLLAEEGQAAVGHALFTHVELVGAAQPAVAAAILAPLAVRPSAQRSGVGRALMDAGCALLAARGVGLVLVLGDPAYYTRCGFTAALPLGLQAPYAIKPEAAWMVRATAGSAVGMHAARVRCAQMLAPEKYWRH